MYEEKIDRENSALGSELLVTHDVKDELTVIHKVTIEGLWVAVAILAVGLVVAFNPAGLAALYGL